MAGDRTRDARLPGPGDATGSTRVHGRVGLRIPKERQKGVSRNKNTPRETSLVVRIAFKLRSTPFTYFRNIHGSAYQPGLPDFVGCHRGRFFAIECKRKSQEPTPLQVVELMGIQQSGGAANWFDDYDEFAGWWAEFRESSGG